MAKVTKDMEWYVGTEWKMDRKGLRKEVLQFEFKNLEKPHEFSKVVIIIEKVNNLNARPSRILNDELIGKEQELMMGTGLTPVDCYVEILVQQMMPNERARCYIKTKSDEEITFDAKLVKIIETKSIHKLSVHEIYEVALRYKENGVAMFKTYPIFAHDYFVRAAKCLISFKPFEGLTAKNDGMDGTQLEALFVQIQTNIAACLLNEQRYEDVIYQTKFVDTMSEPPEKGIYRRAKAFYHIKEYQQAQDLIEKVPNYHEKKEFTQLHHNVQVDWKNSNDHYKNIVQRMFTS